MRRLVRHAVRPIPVLFGRSAGLALAVGLVAWLATGCAWLDHQLHRNEVAPHAISLHPFAEPGSDVGRRTQMVADAAGTRRLCIGREPILSNRQVREGKLEDTADPNRPALRLLLDRQGSMLWLQACQEATGDRVAVMLDGFFWYSMTLPRPVDTQSILLTGPIGRVEAQAIVDSIPGQYRRLNTSTGLF